MLGHDNPQPQEMVLKGSVEGKTYVGPGPDREVVSFDGQALILKWVDPEIAGRYGIMVLTRCSPEEMPLTVRPKSGDAEAETMPGPRKRPGSRQDDCTMPSCGGGNNERQNRYRILDGISWRPGGRHFVHLFRTHSGRNRGGKSQGGGTHPGHD
jgi:hypothetical protein